MRNNLLPNINKIIKKSFSTNVTPVMSHQLKYFRISPATRFWMLQLGYSEADLPKDQMIINKYIFQNLLKNGLQKKLESADKDLNKASASLCQNNTPFDLKLNDNLNLQFNKNYIPHSYYNETVIVNNLINHVNEINEKHKSNIGLEDFLVRSIAFLINKNQNLKKIYDPNKNKFVSYNSDIDILLENNHKGHIENYILKNPHKYNLAEINKIKFNLLNSKEKYIPMVRVYNYSDLKINFIDQILTPPALFSLTIGKIYNDFEINQESNKFRTCKKLNLRLTTSPSAFDENEIVDLLNKLGGLINNPLTISL